MSNQLTLKNFADVLDPDVLDEAESLLSGDSAIAVRESEPGFWETRINKAKPAIELSAKGVVTGMDCDCTSYTEDGTVCKHLAAMLYALRTKLQGSGKPKEAKASKTPKADKKGNEPKKVKKQDPAEALLAQLEPKEIYEFVRQHLAKDKSFKSQFLMHFSEKDENNTQKFQDIVLNAIQAVRGRRKNLQAADGAKIATALTPLRKQAAAAEAKGYFREAYAICRALLQEVPKVMVDMANQSAKLNTLIEGASEVLFLLLEGDKAPYELKHEIFDWLIAEWRAPLDGQTEATIELYGPVLRAARVLKRQGELEPVLKQSIAFWDSKNAPGGWSRYHHLRDAVDRLKQLYLKDLEAPEKAEALLAAHKQELYFYQQLVAVKIAQEDYKTARTFLLDIKKNLSTYQRTTNLVSTYGLEKEIDVELLNIAIKLQDKQAVAALAAVLFKAESYRGMRYYHLEKQHTDAAEWPSRVEYYLKLFSKDLKYGSFWSQHIESPYAEVLCAEERWEDMKVFLQGTSQLKYWCYYSKVAREYFPDFFLEKSQVVLDENLVKSTPSEYERITDLLGYMADTPGGAETVRRLLFDYRQKYANRAALLNALRRVAVT